MTRTLFTQSVTTVICINWILMIIIPGWNPWRAHTSVSPLIHSQTHQVTWLWNGQQCRWGLLSLSDVTIIFNSKRGHWCKRINHCNFSNIYFITRYKCLWNTLSELYLIYLTSGIYSTPVSRCCHNTETSSMSLVTTIWIEPWPSEYWARRGIHTTIFRSSRRSGSWCISLVIEKFRVLSGPLSLIEQEKRKTLLV